MVFHDYDRDGVFDNADEFADMVTRFWLPPVEISVSIDVLPGSTRNPILLRRGGVVPVAILTTASFDALAIDPASLCFGAAPPDPPRSDCTSDAERQLGTDKDSDGDLDLVIHFQVDESGLLRGDVEACLTGLTLDGTAIVGCDAVDAR